MKLSRPNRISNDSGAAWAGETDVRGAVSTDGGRTLTEANRIPPVRTACVATLSTRFGLPPKEPGSTPWPAPVTLPGFPA